MKKIICFLALLTGMFNLCAQNNVDSLVNELNADRMPSTKKLELYYSVCRLYSKIDIDKMLTYAEKGLTLAENEKDYCLISKFNEFFAQAYYTKTDYDKALMYLDKALSNAIKARDKEQELSLCVSIGASHGQKSEYTTALEYFLKALSLCEITGNKTQHTKVLGNIGGMYQMLGNTDRAIDYLEKAKTMAEELDNPIGKMQVYYELGNIYNQQGYIERTLEYLLKTAEISREVNNNYFAVLSNEALAMIYFNHYNDYDKALEYAHANLQLVQEIGYPEKLPGSWTVLSNIYLAQHNWKESELSAFNAWKIDSIRLDYAPNIAFNIIVSNIQMNNKERAITFLQKYKSFKNQYNDKSFHQALTEMEVKYETEKKEVRIATLEKEKQFYIWLSIAGAAVLLLAFGTLFYRDRMNMQKRKVAEQQRAIAEQQRKLAEQKIKQLEQEKQLVAAQSVLEGESAERSRLARDLHDGLGGLLSVVKLNLNEVKGYTVLDNTDVTHFDKAMEMLDESIGELRRVAHHIMPESLMRYGLRVSLEDFCRAIPGADFQYYGSNTRLDNRLEVLVYRCAYELMNNAVKHADATAIDLQLMADNGLVSLTVRDNGHGFDPATIIPGAGLENIRARVSAYNGKMNIYSSPGKGTEVSIEVEQIKTSST